MGKLALAVLLMTGIAAADKAPAVKTPSLIGTWRVFGCETSPKDPANCAKGKIVFEAKRWKLDLPCCKLAKDYKVVSTAADRIVIDSEGRQSEITFDAKGEAFWHTRIDGRVGGLSFARDK